MPGAGPAQARTPSSRRRWSGRRRGQQVRSSKREPQCCDSRLKYRPADAGHSVEHGQNPQGIWLRSPETEQMMTEASAQQPSVPPPPAPAHVAGMMRSAVTTVERNDHVAAAAYLMRRKGVTALVLVDAQTNRPIGLITEADLVQLMADGRDPDAVRIHELMATRLSVIKATASIRDAANTMLAGRFRHLPVIESTSQIFAARCSMHSGDDLPVIHDRRLAPANRLADGLRRGPASPRPRPLWNQRDCSGVRCAAPDCRAAPQTGPGRPGSAGAAPHLEPPASGRSRSALRQIRLSYGRQSAVGMTASPACRPG